MTHDSGRREAALDWLVRTNDPDFDAWDEFTIWLEADFGQCRRLSRTCGQRMEMRPFVKAPVLDEPVRRPERRRLALIPASLRSLPVQPQSSRPAHHARRLFDRPGRGAYRLAGRAGPAGHDVDSRLELRLASTTARSALNRARCCFASDPGQDKVELRSGDLELVDIGTIFEVPRDGHATAVVSEGAVIG